MNRQPGDRFAHGADTPLYIFKIISVAHGSISKKSQHFIAQRSSTDIDNRLEIACSQSLFTDKTTGKITVLTFYNTYREGILTLHIVRHIPF